MTSKIQYEISRVFVAYLGNTMVGYEAIISMPTGTIKNCYRVHRLVILPDYQGMGIGTRFNDYCCNVLAKEGKRVLLITANHKLMNYVQNSKNWVINFIEMKTYKKSYDKYKTTLRYNENPYLVKKPFKVYDGDLGWWINRKLLSSYYVCDDYHNKSHKIIVFEAKANEMDAINILKKHIDLKYYYDVYCEDGKSNGKITKMFNEKFNMYVYSLSSFNTKNLLNYNKDEIIYIYDSNHCKFINELKNYTCVEANEDCRNLPLIEL